MKKFKISIVIVFVIVFTFGSLTNISLAGSKKALVKELKKNVNYSYDLNKDGKKDKIYYTSKCNRISNRKYKHTIKLYVNNKLVKTKTATTNFDAWTYEINLYDLNKKDKYIDMVVDLRQSMELSYLSDWRYKSGKIIEYSLDVNKIPRVSKSCYTIYIEEAKGDGNITLYCEDVYGRTFMNNCQINITYKVDNSGVHKPTSYTFNTNSYTRSFKYKTKYKVTSYTTTSSTKKAFTIKKNEIVRIYALYRNKSGTTYVKVKNSKSHYGWVKVGNKKLFENTIDIQ